MANIKIKRVYEPASNADGYRVLVDRLWPRGLKKENASVDEWLKEVAPSAGLRKWFAHEEEKWAAFCEKYKEELKSNNSFDELKKVVKKHKLVTLLFGAKDEQHNQAVVLKELLSDLRFY